VADFRLSNPSKSAASHRAIVIACENICEFNCEVRRSMMLWKNYHLARNLQDALEVMAAAQRESQSASLVAGGTDLLLDVQQGRHPPVDLMVDLTAIPEMTVLEVRQERLYIGAAVPLNRLIANPLVRQHAEALYEACSLIGGPQVRNTATLGGNVGHALPAADGTIALLAMDAQAEIASLDGLRIVPVEKLFLGPGRSALDPARELLTGFSLSLRQPDQGSAFRRVMRPQGVAIAILNFAAWVERNDQHISQVRLSIGPAGPTPLRAHAAEQVLTGSPFTPASLEKAYAAILAEARPHRATAEYRRHLARVLFEETLTTAWERAAKTQSGQSG
jgi:CO/xanthine dehydrogenase FAD-binding subunit